MADLPFKFDPHQRLFLPAEFEAPTRWEREYLCEFPVQETAPDVGSVAKRAGIEIKSSPAIARGEMLMSSGGRVVARMKNVSFSLRKNEPCSSTCMFHVTHPCERCGRQWGPKKKVMERKDAFWRE